jgi:hypothetical protein
MKLPDGAKFLQRKLKDVSFIFFPECGSLIAQKACKVSLLYDNKIPPKCRYSIRSAQSFDIDGFIIQRPWRDVTAI